ncbi:la-related protein 7 [Bombus impatiens]|uniref:La-related protein 7 n=1 Tax=Bombus impatiens TaxID=132113 RepID=A0A6P3DY85_BOMIM|nr:la-related protein 7 [Bombus impatiens]XP_012241106.1 la-related protein 7 [Bombus impatiens]XP_012241107.1 la-related protein 7 [Bombus impatiens]XP_012241108.1 la-related protein 7 [Bombus impatiens]XP_033176599.1 la-related protein 7 [Bombus impatiens]
MVMEEQQSDMELDSERVPVPQVQKSVEDSRIETVNKVTSISRGKPRLRKKALHAAILKQMEFYFSDANLSKDRFLSNLVKEDPYVDLSVFLKFNKIRELTTDINRISKGVQASTILSLSEDGMKVRRITPIAQKENTDECTVYVQNLPPDTDHETLSSIFSQYGQVVYVSIPRFKNNKKIKGFAFVEFDTIESAKNCLKAFEKKGCVLPSYTAPDKLLSITTFDNAEKDVTLGNEKSICSENANEKLEDTETDRSNEQQMHTNINNTSENHDNNNKKKAKKRRHSDTESAEPGETEEQMDSELIKSKKKKLKNPSDLHSGEIESSNEKQNDVFLEGTQRKLNKCERNVPLKEEQVSDNCDENEQMVIDDSTILNNKEQENTNEKKKKRKKRKKQSKLEDFSYSIGLQVMAKKDWKCLRNKYLELQRSKMKQLKQHLRKTRWTQWSNYEKNKPERVENDEKDKTGKQNSVSACRFSFTSGVIVKIEMDKPCTDPKSLKMELKNNSSVKYIDVEDGSCFAYVRCDTSEAAQAFIQKSDEERNMRILEGEEEKMYWDKILHDREEKLSKKVKIKQRGRNKLLKKAEKELGKHIKFDEV